MFLSPDEEAEIVRYLDEMVTRLRTGEQVPYPAVADAGMLLCAQAARSWYQAASVIGATPGNGTVRS